MTSAAEVSPVDANAPAAADDMRASRAWTRLVRSPSAWLGAAITMTVVLIAILAPWISPYGVNDRDEAFLPPSKQHWLGTDSNQYDVLTRTLHGARLSILAGGLSVVLAVVVGASAGLLAGYLGGGTDIVIMRSVEVSLAFPAILIALLLVVALSPGWPAVIFAVSLINVPLFARQVRASVLSLREQEYVLAAIALGADPWYVMTRVLAPSLVSPIVVLATLGLATAILEVAGLAFLGVAGDPSAAEWGLMLADAKGNLSSSLWPAIAPGVAISLTILGFNLLGDGLRDALDPKLDTHGTGLPW